MKADSSSTSNVVRDLYGGITEFKILSFNPNLATLKKLGYNFQAEPDYLVRSPEGVVIGCNFTFYLYHEELNLTIQVRFRVVNEQSVSPAKGSKEYINDNGACAWVKSIDDLDDRFSRDGLRVALKGESNLIKFLKVFLNITGEGQIAIDLDEYKNQYFKGIFSGKDGDIAMVIADKPHNRIQLPIGVQVSTKDGVTKFYQSVYGDFPIYVWAKIDKATVDRLDKHAMQKPEKYRLLTPIGYNLSKFNESTMTFEGEENTSSSEALDDDLPF